MKSNRIAIAVLVAAASVAAAYAVFAPRAAGSKQGAASVASAASSGPPKVPECAIERDRCGCMERHATEHLQADRSAKALELLNGDSGRCENRNALDGMRAEALAAAGRPDEARALSREVLTRDPINRFARRAVGIADVETMSWTEADAILGKLISEDPNDVTAVFYAAVANSRRDRYNDARQGFMRVLRLSKKHVGARYNLVLLTAGAGVTAEARHHLEELEAIAADDPRLENARAVMRDAPDGGGPPPVIVKQTGSQ